MDANARAGQRVVGCGDGESRVLAGAYGRDVLDDNGKLFSFATNCKMALTNTYSTTCKGGRIRTKAPVRITVSGSTIS